MRYAVANMGPYLAGEVELPVVYVLDDRGEALALVRQLFQFYQEEHLGGDFPVEDWEGEDWMVKEGQYGVALSFDSGSRDTALVANNGLVRSDGELFTMDTTKAPSSPNPTKAIWVNEG